MSIKNKAKDVAKKKIKKLIIHMIKPFLPFILIIILIIFAFCTLIDSLFSQSIETSETMMSEDEFFNIENEDIDGRVSMALDYADIFYEGTPIPTNNGSAYISKDMFTWPIPGYTTITSSFGNRLDPITQKYSLHAGTDVSAPVGADFVAMADGIIIRSDYSNSYGNVVMIDHRKWHCNFICSWLKVISRKKSKYKKR